MQTRAAVRIGSLGTCTTGRGMPSIIADVGFLGVSAAAAALTTILFSTTASGAASGLKTTDLRASAMRSPVCRMAVALAPAPAGEATVVGARRPRTVKVRISGRIAIEAAKKTHVIEIGEAGRRVAGSKVWRLTRRIKVRGVRPLWERADGRPIAEDRAYRKRRFTEDGELIGRAADITLQAELLVAAPGWIRGVRVRIELDDFAVSAHRYQTRWGRVKSVDRNASEIGHLPAQSITIRTGQASGTRAVRYVKEAKWRTEPGRADVVRMAGYAFGLGCCYPIIMEGFVTPNVGCVDGLSPAPSFAGESGAVGPPDGPDRSSPAMTKQPPSTALKPRMLPAGRGKALHSRPPECVALPRKHDLGAAHDATRDLTCLAFNRSGALARRPD